MSEKTVLVIDDSATIRKLVDSHLSPVGYHVVLAANAEDGLEMAANLAPDLILLDHQLPGTTGHQVASQLAQMPDLQSVPVVVSSTLRKKAYAEYVDLDNVVDLLPKPYTDELLRTTVANAIETAALIVQSQTQGTAVPETIHAVGEASLAGSMSYFTLRELIDFLNNGSKAGVLEVETENCRIRIHLNKGRIQAVHALGVSEREMAKLVQQLPEALQNLAPILKMTISGAGGTQFDGFVQLLNQKVLDPRLMSKLLRFQAAMLLRQAFQQKLTAFRFEADAVGSQLTKSLPLDISLLALLVEGAITAQSSLANEDGLTYVRRVIRGQNLDRAGLSARHMKVLNVLSEAKSIEELRQSLDWPVDEIKRVLHGFELAELVESRKQAVPGQFVIYEPDAQRAQELRESIEQTDGRYTGKVVRDNLALKLVLKRSIPHTLIFSGDEPESCRLMQKVFTSKNPHASRIKRIAMVQQHKEPQEWMAHLGFQPDSIHTRPCTAFDLFAEMDRLLMPPSPRPKMATQVNKVTRRSLIPANTPVRNEQPITAKP